MPFNKDSDKIAVVIKEFSVGRKISDPGIYGEPYIVSLAVDEHGIAENKIGFNCLPFPRVRRGDTISFDGQGHLIYGPSNPGEFLAYSILFMECDKDIREVGSKIRKAVNSDEAKAIVRAASTALGAVNVAAGAALGLLDDLVSMVARQMEKNKDDELFRRSGTLFRDAAPPFDILRTYTSGNDYIAACKTSIIPLPESNGLGSQIEIF